MNKKANLFVYVVFILFCLIFISILVAGGIFLGELRTKQAHLLEGDFWINDSISNYSLYPDRTIVTGDILERNKSTICKTGYSSTVRNVPLSLRKKVFARDGVEYPQPRFTYELDHWYPLCMGGSNDESNLFVQFEPNYKWKDRVEVYLCKELCRTNQSVDEVAEKIWNWHEIYLNISNNS